MLEQVIFNLLNNAATHTPCGTTIEVTVACHADRLQIIIEDNGKGFTEVEMKDVFHKSARNKNPKTSSRGLGLSIVKGFTDALNGQVELEKGREGGARFTITMPVKTSTIAIYK